MVRTRSGRSTDNVQPVRRPRRRYMPPVSRPRSDTPDWYSALENQPIRSHVYLPKQYRPRDTAKRHRIFDEEERDEVVRTYRRRPVH